MGRDRILDDEDEMPKEFDPQALAPHIQYSAPVDHLMTAKGGPNRPGNMPAEESPPTDQYFPEDDLRDTDSSEGE